MTTIVKNPLVTANSTTASKAFFMVNTTKEGETLYFLPDAPLLVIVSSDKKALHFVHGDTAEFLYKRLAIAEYKKKYCKNVKRMMEFFYKKIDESSAAFHSMAALEEIIESCP